MKLLAKWLCFKSRKVIYCVYFSLSNRTEKEVKKGRDTAMIPFSALTSGLKRPELILTRWTCLDFIYLKYKPIIQALIWANSLWEV